MDAALGSYFIVIKIYMFVCAKGEGEGGIVNLYCNIN